VRRPRPAPQHPPRQRGGFPRPKSLDDFDFDANPNIPAATIHTLASCAWIRNREPLCLIGDSGTGKSQLTGRPKAPDRKIYPVILVAYGFPVNPLTMAEIHERVTRAGLLQGPYVGRLEIIDLDAPRRLTCRPGSSRSPTSR
jgi:hypothetical protein